MHIYDAYMNEIIDFAESGGIEFNCIVVPNRGDWLSEQQKHKKEEDENEKKCGSHGNRGAGDALV